MTGIQHIASQHFLPWVEEEDGATAIEYAFIIGLVSIAIGFAVPEIGVSIDQLFSRAATSLNDSLPGT